MRRLRRAVDPVVCRLRTRTGRQARRTAPDHPRGSIRACRCSRSAATPARAGKPSSRSRSTAAPTWSRRWRSRCEAGLARLLDLGRRRRAGDRRARADPAIGRPAPRWRSGHPHGAAAATAGLPGVDVVAALRMRAFVRDSVGLSSADRQRNIAGRVKVVKPVGRRRAASSTTSSPPAPPPANPSACCNRSGRSVVAVLAVANA